MCDAVATDLAETSVGLASEKEYTRKCEEVEVQGARKAAPRAAAAPAGVSKKKKKKKASSAIGMLSFDEELDAGNTATSTSPRLLPMKMGKCQDVDVSFLKKNEREEQEARKYEEAARREYVDLHQRAKNEEVALNYTFRSEATQRELYNGVYQGEISLARGLTAEEVCRAVRLDVERLGEKFKLIEVAGKTENRECILTLCANGMERGSFTIPSAITLVEVGAMRWSEGGSLFDDFRAGIVVTERRWHEQMRHTYPYSQWEVLDMHKTYSQKEHISKRNARTGVDPVRR